MKRFACGDVVPGCEDVFLGATEDEVLDKALQHAADAHGMTEVSEETMDHARGLVTTVA
ncbi:DUF1059 domain-containing protein [Aeromicrobium sp. IC_218]|uniref:DUF1059 domain-containing protein n=1 Tax=Aeromicrobium sp. IC_218 TaxID=2545468 RepID=UPI00103BB338|nr:DUF1059 domain-containing protein [Aeromicrobium sp. IC_218]TCI98850.1 DUF1059 domain-containing protein [Aeromicrobium sp. IC_218]